MVNSCVAPANAMNPILQVRKSSCCGWSQPGPLPMVQETRYYITSFDNANPEEIATAIRQYWSIENNLHWQLDVTFREDYSKKIQNATRNFSTATKIVLSVFKNDKITKGSMNLKRLKTGWDENYLCQDIYR